MNADIVNLLVLGVSVSITFFIARRLGTGWRARRRDKTEQARRDAESRQVRRARERRVK